MLETPFPTEPHTQVIEGGKRFLSSARIPFIVLESGRMDFEARRRVLAFFGGLGYLPNARQVESWKLQSLGVHVPRRSSPVEWLAYPLKWWYSCACRVHASRRFSEVQSTDDDQAAENLFLTLVRW
jgi:hypothetical protein